MIDGVPVSDGFDFPVGPRGDNVNVWDTHRVDALLVDPAYKKLFGFWHTGEDWNGKSGGDSDLGQPVYAIAHGRLVEFGYYVPSWGNVVLLEHILPDGTRVWSQYAHLDQMMVNARGQIIGRGQQLGTIGKGERTAQYPLGRWVAHLHFEIRRNNLPIYAWVPYVNDREQVLANYFNPTAFINDNRPQRLAVAAAAPPVSVQRPTLIVDSQRTDPAAGIFRRANVDYWYSAPFGYQGAMLWTFASASTETNWAEWRPALSLAGYWEVAAFVPEQHATTTNARYTVFHADGRTEVAVNQSNYHNHWVPLGTFRFEPGQGLLRLSDVTGETRRGVMVGFDAARWIKVD
jgi:hypothetical protein